MKKEEMNFNLKKINQLLNDEELLNHYIEEIESNKLTTPKDLERRVKNRLNNEKKGTKISQISHKISYLDVLKIAACTIFATLIWQFLSAKPVNANVNITNTHKEEIYTQIDQVMQSINNFFMKPIDIKMKGDQK